MASAESVPAPTWRQRSLGIGGRSLLNLVNLLLRDTSHRLTTLQRGGGPDPEVYVVTRVDWRGANPASPVLVRLPRLLSILEALRGTRGVPSEIYLDSTDGIIVYLPTGIRVSELSNGTKSGVKQLVGLVEDTVNHLYSTVIEVEEWFWKAARQRGFSPEIVERIGRCEPHYDSPSHRLRFEELLHSYFSIRFRVYRAEGCLRVEGRR
ncbi:MAG: hypothetical protein ACTSVD_02725 [Candidatus Thorarchaeota archaeon]